MQLDELVHNLFSFSTSEFAQQKKEPDKKNQPTGRKNTSITDSAAPSHIIQSEKHSHHTSPDRCSIARFRFPRERASFILTLFLNAMLTFEKRAFAERDNGNIDQSMPGRSLTIANHSQQPTTLTGRICRAVQLSRKDPTCAFFQTETPRN